MVSGDRWWLAVVDGGGRWSQVVKGGGRDGRARKETQGMQADHAGNLIVCKASSR